METIKFKTAYTDPYKTRTCMYNSPPEDEPSGSKRVEDIKIRKLKY